MNIDTLKTQLPDYAKDIKLNLSSLSTIETLSQTQVYGTLLASALAAGNKTVIDAVMTSIEEANVDNNTVIAAKAANSLMAMTNIYYRSMHFFEDKEYMQLPANLRMNFMKDPGVEKVDFELYSLAVSAINGCQFCVKSHERSLLKHGVEKSQIQQAIRIAAIIHATANSL